MISLIASMKNLTHTCDLSQVIAVNQDPLGKQGTRVVGGPLLDTMADGRHPAGNTPATLVSCNVKDATQKWVLNTPAAG